MPRRLKGAEADEPEPLKNAGLRPALAQRIDRFILDHPEFGISYRNEFANRACEEYLARLERRVLVSKALEAAEKGEASPFEALRRVSLQPEQGG